jgi:hypothetical protein
MIGANKNALKCGHKITECLLRIEPNHSDSDHNPIISPVLLINFNEFCG